jgi:hypothetical protein
MYGTLWKVKVFLTLLAPFELYITWNEVQSTKAIFQIRKYHNFQKSKVRVNVWDFTNWSMYISLATFKGCPQVTIIYYKYV